jgi:predicted TIM-barrel fold metal-dependent hydrolase
MARSGYKIFDADSHVRPDASLLDPYLSNEIRQKLREFERYRSKDVAGSITYLMGARDYKRRLGLPHADFAEKSEYMKGYKRHQHGKPDPRCERDPAARLKDMDLEGIDVELMLPSGWFGTWTTVADVQIETAMYEAYHRWMREYCSQAADRLKGVILVAAREIASSLREIERWGKESWPLAIFVYTPANFPLDHPDLEPVWKAAADYDLSVALHTFTAMPPYAPGGLDSWDNLWLQRSAAHPWCGQRNMAALIGSGVMDRYPNLRIGTLEAGHGWLPSWVNRLEEHTALCPEALPLLKQTIREYVTGGRYFQSIEISEGGAITKAVIDLLGPDILMFGSDYPHGESWFPASVETVLKWQLKSEDMQKLLWDNAVRFYPRYSEAPRK